MHRRFDMVSWLIYVNGRKAWYKMSGTRLCFICVARRGRVGFVLPLQFNVLGEEKLCISATYNWYHTVVLKNPPECDIDPVTIRSVAVRLATT